MNGELPGGLKGLMADVGEARPAVVESRELRRHRFQVAQQCMDVAARLMVLASELDPDMPGVVAPSVGSRAALDDAINRAVESQRAERADWRGTGPGRNG